MDKMSDDRQHAIRIMSACGWKHSRDGKRHEFIGEGCSLHGYDLARVSHSNLSIAWALRHCGHQELERRLEATRRDWLAEFLPKRAEN